MTVYLPWGLVLIFISLSMFYYFSQVSRIKREKRRERRDECRQQFLDSFLKRDRPDD